MKHLRFSLIAVLAMMAVLLQAQSNVLRVDSVKYPAGKTVTLPIILENQSDITGVQFDISVPYELATDSDGIVICELAANRAPYHKVVSKKTGTDWRKYTTPEGSVSLLYQNYRIIVYSDQNQLLLDNQGTLLTLHVPVAVELTNETKLPIYLLDNSVILANRQKENVVTGQNNGLIIIEEIPRPDLTPTDVTFTQTSVQPGGKLSLSWNVKNVGKIPTEDGWSEQISLVTVTGNLTKLIATTYYEEILAAGNEVARTAEIDIPALLGLDGIVKVQVNVVPNEKTGEHPSLRDNNIAQSATNISVEKLLTLELSRLHVTEGSNQRITAKLSRSGRWNNVRTFTVTVSPNDSRLEMPEHVSIPANQSGVVFYIDVKDNDVLDTDSIVDITVSGDNYEPATARITIEDNEFPALTVKASKSIVTEGETFQLTISTERMATTPVTVMLTSEDNKRFKYPAQAIIPAGEQSVTVDVTAVDNDVPNLEQANIFTASAQNYTKGEATVILKDNDMPALTLTLTPNTVSEAAGVTTVTAELHRTGITNNKITIKISDDSNGGLYYSNNTLVMDKGVETIFFNLGPVDNVTQEGDRTYSITASVWVSSCSCDASGESAGSVKAQLTVLDNDGAALSISSQSGTVKEGDETVLTINRNTIQDISQPLTVTLSSNYDSELEYQNTVTIPAGETSTEVKVVSKRNEVSGDSHTVIFTVASEGYASGTCFLIVTDQTLPDAIIESVSANVEEAMVGTAFDLSVTIKNDGAYQLQQKTPIAIYLKGTTKAVATIYTTRDITVGATETITRSIALPDKVGSHVYYVVVNEQQQVGELNYANNTSQEVTVKATSPFTAKVQTNKSVYRQGETVTITGQLTGEKAINSKIDVYMVNDGAREVKNVTTNAEGEFSIDWQLYALQSGHFSVGACYKDDPTMEEMATFDVYGLKRAENSYITCDVTCGEPYSGRVKLVNAGSLPLSGIKTEVVGAPEGCDAKFNLPSDISANQEVDMSFVLNGTVASPGNNWELIKVRITSKEGAFLEVSLHYFARLALGNLAVEKQNLVTTMNKDNGRDYSFFVTNTGKGNTGKITLSLPSWMTPLTGASMPGLKQNDTTTVVVRMMPTNDMQLNVPVTGMMGINCENGNGTYINYTITPVSDQTGTITIDVCDEYTYYTEEKPHVKDAEIVLRNPVTGALVAQGTSDENGLYSITLPEGYYQLNVTADNHNSYKNNVLVDPGRNILHTVSLSYQAVSVSWDVEETEVEDEYSIVTTVKYETNVPAPVVETIQPDKIDILDLGVGESIIFYATLTNKGLIAAQNTYYTIADRIDDFTVEPLVECNGITLAPQQSYMIPVKVTRVSPESSRSRRASGNSDCYLATGTGWEVKCGDDYQKHSYPKPITYKVCDGGLYQAIVDAGGGLGSPYGYGGGSGYTASSSTTTVSTSSGCNECLKDLSHKITLGGDLMDCGAIKFTPFIGCVYGIGRAVQGALNNWYEGTTSDWVMWWLGTINTGVSCVFPPAGPITGGIGCALGLIDIANGCGGHVYFSRPDKPLKEAYAAAVYVPSWVDLYKQRMENARNYYNAVQNYMNETYGSPRWCEVVTAEESQDLIDAVELAVANKTELTAEALHVYKPMDITDEEFAKFIERVNNSLLYAGTETEVDNMINVNTLYNCLTTMHDADSIVKTYGYESIGDMMIKEYETLVKKVEEENASVCATISLQIEQTMTMTRQAFRGTLSVTNGNPELPMRDIKLKLNVTNKATDQMATAKEFEMHTEKLKMFEGDLDMESGWYLGADSTGTATILFIPSKYAAPEQPVDYAFGGTLSYIDPNSGLQVTRELYPVTLTVKPSPELDLTYFMQRDVYGDDALTEEVEPMEPAEFALIINNKGNGDATNVKMATNQPKIIDNQKGLYIDFEFISSQLNGQEKALALGQSILTDFGNIPSHQQAYAQWWLQSTLLGHFVDYDVQATHVTSYGNENLSLLDQVTIHELIHGFTPVRDSADASGRAFLVNDVVDSDDLPDAVYFTDATQDVVNIVSLAEITKSSQTEYELTMTPTVAGWTYGSLLDPTVGRQKLISIVRVSDGKEMPLDNVWQTNRTLVDGKEHIKENRIHFVANVPFEGETYKLIFAQKPGIELEVKKFSGVPAAGTLQTEQLKEVTVTFNKAIDESTFTTEDITLACQGVLLDTKLITIEKQSDTEFKLDLSSVSGADGYYVLTVQCATITDHEGFLGATGKQATWVQYSGGKVNIALKASPADAGTIEPASGTFDYNQPVTLTATAAEGYDFSLWKENGQTISEEPSFSYTPQGSTEITAVFTPKYFDINVTFDPECGTVEGGGTGRHAYGTQLSLNATPQEGYQFSGWIIDNDTIGTEPTLTWTVTSTVTIIAAFNETASISLSGKVTDANDDTPIEGAVVTLVNGDIIYTAVTDKFGEYKVEVAEKELTFDITCRADGFMWSSSTQIWFTSGPQTKNFVLLPGATIIIPENGICTFSSTAPLNFHVEGLKAWYISKYIQQGFVVKELASAAADEGLILVGTAGKRYDLSVSNTADPLSDNMLTGTSRAPYIVNDNNVYVLHEGANADSASMARMYLSAKGMEIARYKAYCQYSIATEPATVGIIWDEETLTRIVEAALKGNDGTHYNLGGRPVQKNDKGIHLDKGRKIVVK